MLPGTCMIFYFIFLFFSQLSTCKHHFLHVKNQPLSNILFGAYYFILISTKPTIFLVLLWTNFSLSIKHATDHHGFYYLNYTSRKLDLLS